MPGIGAGAASMTVPGASEPTAAGDAETRFELLDDSLADSDHGLPLGALAQAVPALLFACTPDGRVAYVNRHWFEYTGLNGPQALAAHWQELVHPDDQLRLLSQWHDGHDLGRGDTLETQFRLRHASGEFRWHISRSRLLRDGQGRPRMWTGSATEIERQRRVEDALDRREREFRTLVDNAPDGITRLDRQLRHIYANQAIENAFGVPPSVLVGRTAEEAGLPREISEGWREAALRAFMQNQEQECEFSAPSKRGEERHLVCRLIPELDVVGRMESVLCIAYDVTHRRRALLALKYSEQRFRQFAQSSEDVFWFADLEAGELLYVSPAVERLWGVRPEALLADPSLWMAGLAPEDRARVPSPFYASTREPEGHEPVREYRLFRADGTTLWIRDRRFHLQQAADGRVLRIGGIAEDITERKLRDLEREELLARERAARGEAEALARAKDEFLAVVSHELRSPLNAIRGWAHVLRKTAKLPPEQTKPLDAIDRNVAAQARMVDDLLDTQRLLRGKVALEMRRTPLRTLVDQAVETFRPLATDKQLTLGVCHADETLMIEADPDRLRQAFVNLLSNAVKFTPPEGRVEVITERRGDCAAIVVSDTGVGLEPAQQARVFEPFRQAAGTYSTRRQGGLGLGLALARQLVELHQGRMGVHSEGLDRGAAFTIELPVLRSAESSPVVVQQEPSKEPSPPLAGRRVAVLDDDPEGRQILELLLREEAIRAVFFSNTGDAFRYLSNVPPEERPEVIISDIAMPGEDGYSFMRRLRELQRRRGEPELPAVAITAFSSSTDRIRALAAGFNAHLGKPMDPEQLRATLKELLRDAISCGCCNPAGT